MRVYPLVDFDQIHAFLETDRLWTAYAIGDLEPAMRPLCEWHGAEEGGQLCALTLLYKGFHPSALFTLGNSQGLALIIGSAMRVPEVYLNAREEHLPTLQAHYRIPTPEPMWRMALKPEEFRPVAGPVTHLTPQYTRELQRLYAMGGGDAFTPSQVFAGAFFGVEERGLLVAAAGTHVLSETYGAAAVGNVFTQPEHRGRGYAARVTSAVCAELIRRGVQTIVLNVSQKNVAAIHIYEKLGFKKSMPFVEGVAVRKTAG